jgi:hypothetical protein
MEMRIMDTYRNRIQRVEGANHAPTYVIYDEVYLVECMEESYVTSGLDGAHHILNARVVDSKVRGARYFDLFVDYTANYYTLTPVEEV